MHRILWGLLVKIFRYAALRTGIGISIAVATLTAIGAQQFAKATLAPHELHPGDAPPPIIWAPPALPDSINVESAEERRLRVRVLAKGLEQPWSLAFLPPHLRALRPSRCCTLMDLQLP